MALQNNKSKFGNALGGGRGIGRSDPMLLLAALWLRPRKRGAGTIGAALVLRIVFVALGVGLPALDGTASAQPADAIQRLRCLACHAGDNRLTSPTKAAPTRGGTVNLADFRDADHGTLHCLDCHSKGFANFPHRGMKTETCMDCHPRKEKGAEDDKPYDFDRMREEYEGTVHFTEFRDAKEKCCGTSTGKPAVAAPATTSPENDPHHQAASQRFTCEHCHEPHYFKATKRIKEPALILQNDNRPCLTCHDDDASGPLSDPAEPSLLKAHSYLPHAQLHLTGTRCVDCHASVSSAVSHDLPLGKKADQGCNTCHSVDSVLLKRLYRYVDTTSSRLGFRNERILQEGYVIGANRHRWTDAVAYGLMSLCLALVLAHGAWRILARRRAGTPPAETDRS